MIDADAIANRIRDQCKKNNLTVKQVSDCCMVSITTVKRWKKGTRTPSIDSIDVLSDLFGCSTDYLIKGKQ